MPDRQESIMNMGKPDCRPCEGFCCDVQDDEEEQAEARQAVVKRKKRVVKKRVPQA